MDLAAAIPIALIILFGCVVAFCGGMFWLAFRLQRQASAKKVRKSNRALPSFTSRRNFNPCFTPRPPMWLAIRSQSPDAVQEALELDDPTPCSWIESMDGRHTLFITPPINGWLLVIGTDLPNPASDVDECFHFLMTFSRKLGHIQFFQADPILLHHAWARLDRGRVVRAYAWADTTLWNQGIKTAAEMELDMNCFAYATESTSLKWRATELPAANVEKVAALAARWSLDPATIEGRILAQAHGIAGRPSRLY